VPVKLEYTYIKLHIFTDLLRVSESLYRLRYGMDGSGFKLRWRRDFPLPTGPTPRLTQSLLKWVPEFFLCIKVAVVRRWPPIPFYRLARKWVELPMWPLPLLTLSNLLQTASKVTLHVTDAVHINRPKFSLFCCVMTSWNNFIFKEHAINCHWNILFIRLAKWEFF
jgi:hypothetical protein